MILDTLDPEVEQDIKIMIHSTFAAVGMAAMKFLLASAQRLRQRRAQSASGQARTLETAVFDAVEEAFFKEMHHVHDMTALKLQRRALRMGLGSGKSKRREGVGPWHFWRHKPYHFQRFVRFTVEEFDVIHSDVKHLMFVKSSAVFWAMAHPPAATPLMLQNIAKTAASVFEACPIGAAGVEFMRKARLMTDNYIYSSEDRLWVVLYLMASGHRLIDAAPFVDLSEATISTEFRTRVPLLHSYLAKRFIVWPTLAERASVDRLTAGAAFTGAQGVVDGSCFAIRRPDEAIQQDYYAGHKKFHCVCVQFTVDLFGRVIHLTNAVQGTRHDRTIFDVDTSYTVATSYDTYFSPGQWLLGDSGYRGHGEIVYNDVKFMCKFAATHRAERCRPGTRMRVRHTFTSIRQVRGTALLDTC